MADKPKLIIYTLQYCPNCETLKEYLTSEGITCEERDMSSAEYLTDLRVNGVFVSEAPVLRAGSSFLVSQGTSSLQGLSIRNGCKEADRGFLMAGKQTQQTTFAGVFVPQMPPVRTSDGDIIEWDRRRIVDQIVSETKLVEIFYGYEGASEQVANDIARLVDQRICSLGLKALSGPLIREIVNMTLLEQGMVQYRNVCTRVGTPVFDAHLIHVGRGFEARDNANLQENAETSHKKKADKISKEQYLLQLPPHLADHHLSGNNLNYRLTLLFRPDAEALLVTGSAGLMVGVLMLIFTRWPRFELLLPILAAILVSAVVFDLTKRGMVFGPSNLIIPPLVTFLPGATLTTGMIELASRHLISGSARLMYGAASLFLLFIGIGIGLNLTNLPDALVYTYEASVFPWWAPVLGTLLFGVGTFIRLSGANRDLLWMLWCYISP